MLLVCEFFKFCLNKFKLLSGIKSINYIVYLFNKIKFCERMYNNC